METLNLVCRVITTTYNLAELGGGAQCTCYHQQDVVQHLLFECPIACVGWNYMHFGPNITLVPILLALLFILTPLSVLWSTCLCKKDFGFDKKKSIISVFLNAQEMPHIHESKKHIIGL